jgi:uncharacterized integral membrane protein
VKLLWRAAALIFAALAVAFAVANRQPVAVSLSPIPASVELPLYLLVLGALAFGAAIGGIGNWIAGGGGRRVARANRRQAAALEREVVELREGRALTEPKPDAS